MFGGGAGGAGVPSQTRRSCPSPPSRQHAPPNTLLIRHLVDLHRRVDGLHEGVAGVEPDGAREDEEAVAHHEHVAEVQGPRRGLGDVQLGKVVEGGVEEEVHGRGARGEVGPPPPVVVLRAQLEVAQHDGDLRARHDEDDEDDEEEPEDVVELVQPHRGQDEEELNEHSAEGEDAADHDGEDRLHVPRLLGHLAGDLVGAHGVVRRRLLEAEVGPDEHQGH
mmetsp:Transcript_17633/g.57055  ORF Transcript_17633/g.57055 Transcript_17633/m.57055 type:complete len:221 (-) Transcript_17633:1033-1695(-)